jgi:hypothetical protein
MVNLRLAFWVNLPVAAGTLGQFAVRLPYGARQIDPIFLIFFCFSHPEIPKKTYA